jgi:hypothetical protein
MLRPTPGELLDGVRRELAAQVLPALPAGAAARQLRAALHVLGALARSWDGHQHRFQDENADLDASMTAFCDLTGLAREPVAANAPFPGVGDPGLQELMQRNAALQAELEQLQLRWRRDARADPAADRLLHELHVRLTRSDDART